MVMWSIVLAVVGITGQWFAGRKQKSGWAIGVGAQVLWLTYAVVTRQWGFIASALAYGFVYARNWYRWWQEEKRAREGLRVSGG